MLKFFLLSFILISSAQARPILFSSVEPISFLIKEIANESYQVETLIPAGKDPHSFTPSPQSIKKLSDAKAYFLIGAPFEIIIKKRLKDIDNIEIVNLADNQPNKKIQYHHHHNNEQHRHQHTDKDNHQHDPHIWLSPSKLKQIIKKISHAMVKLSPKNKKKYERRSRSLINRLSAIDKSIKKQLAPYKGKTVLVFHPAFAHFLEAYGLHQETVEDNGKSPTIKHIKHILEHVKERNIKVLFTQPQFDRKTAEAIAKGMGGRTEEINALEADILSNFEKMANAIDKALR